MGRREEDGKTGCSPDDEFSLSSRERGPQSRPEPQLSVYSVSGKRQIVHFAACRRIKTIVLTKEGSVVSRTCDLVYCKSRNSRLIASP